MQPDKESKPKKPGRREPSCSRVPSARIRGVVASPYQEGTRRVLLSRRTVREPSSPSVSRDDQGPPRGLSRQTAEEPSSPSVSQDDQGPPRVLSRQTAEEPSSSSVSLDDHRAVIPPNLFATFETTEAGVNADGTTPTRERDSTEGAFASGLDSGIDTTALHTANSSAIVLGVGSASIIGEDSATDESFGSPGPLGRSALDSPRAATIWTSEDDLVPSTDEGSSSTDEENLGMAVRPNRKFERPPIFSGLPTEDVVDWAEQYNLVGDYNAWSCKD